MADLWADFPSGDPGIYGTSHAFMLNGIYAELYEVAIVDDPDPAITGNVLQVAGFSTFDGKTRFVMPATNATAGIHASVWFDALPTGNGDNPIIHQFRTAANVVLVSIVVTANGGIAAYEGGGNSNWGSATLLGQTTGPVITANAWPSIETKMLQSATVGTVEVRVNGVSVLSLTAQDTGAAAVGQLCHVNSFSGSGVGCLYHLKNICYWDGSGSFGTSFIGNANVVRLTPDSDVAMTGWTLSTGSDGFALIDEAPPVDADYISAADPPPSAALCGLSNLPANVTSVRALITVVRAWKTDGGDGSLQVGLKATTLTDLGADNPLTTSASYYFDTSQTDPDTAAAWTPVVVDAAQIQFDRTL